MRTICTREVTGLTLAIFVSLSFASICSAQPTSEIWAPTKQIKEAIGAKASSLAGVSPALPVGIVDHILKHSRIQKLGNYVVVYNPTHRLFIFSKQGANTPSDLRLITVELAQRYMNPDLQVKVQEGPVGEGFIEGPQLLRFWRYLLEDQKFETFFDVSLLTYREENLSPAERARVESALMGPINNLLDDKLGACFNFLDGESWKRDPALTKISDIPPETLATLEPVNFIGSPEEKEVGVLLGDSTVGIVYVLIGASIDANGKCKPSSAEILTPF